MESDTGGGRARWSRSSIFGIMRSTLKVGAFLFVFAFVGFFLSAKAAPVTAPQVLRGHVPSATTGLRSTGRLSSSTNLHLAISLPLRDQAGLTSLLGEINDPASPNYHHYLTPEQFADKFGPTESDYQAVIQFAKANRLTVRGTHSNRILLDVNGTVADIEKTLHVTMQVYQHPTENRTFYAPDAEPALNLTVPVLQVSGLDDYSLARPRLSSTLLAQRSDASPNSGSGTGGAYMGKDFRAAYVPDSTLTGSGQVVGLLQFDGYSASDITYYENKAGLPNVTLQNVLVDGFSGKPSGSGGEVEVCLDIEMAISMAPGLSKVIVYMAPNPSPFVDILNRMATDNLAKQLSCSWYYPNGKADPTADLIFQEMAAQGQSFFNASGDYDAFTGLIDFPGDTPYITQVGGTTLSTSGSGSAWASETVWNRRNGVGSGGGISTQYPIPSWQTNINMTLSQGSTTKRNVPDVAMVAENIYVRANGRDYNVGGTSCSAPLWAGFAALVNQQAVASGKSPIGFVNPAIDMIGVGSKYVSCFHDTITGDNTSSSSPTKFFAVPGYDLCTGWGTPAGQSLINALATPESLGIQPGTGFAAIGGAGGPFTIASQNFVLTNFGTGPLNWSVINTSLWLSVSLGNGTLPSGGPATEVDASLSPAAYSLPIGNYSASLIFSNVSGSSAQTRQFTLQVVPSRPPGILAQPASQTAFVGGNATFNVIISGTPPVSCQWSCNGTNLVTATNAMLTLTNVGFSDAGIYAVRVTNTLGSMTSSNAVLTVLAPPPSATTPLNLVSWWPAEEDANDLAGLNSGFLVNGPSYALGRVGQAFKLNGTNQYVTIADSPSLQPSSFTVEGWFNFRTTDQIRTLIAKAYGNGTLDSYALWYAEGQLYASISTLAGISHWLAFPWSPAPNSWHHVAYTFDADAAFHVLYVDGVAVVADWAEGPIGYDTHPLLIGADIENGSPASLFNGSIDEVSFYDGALGSEEIAAIFSASGSGKRGLPPVILLQPQTQVAALGSTVEFESSAAGTLPLTYQWSFNGTNLAGATNATLCLADVSFSDAGDYAVTVENALGSIASQTATLTVMVPVAITTQPQSQRVAQGTNVSFSVTATGGAPLGYQWYFNGTPLAQATAPTLTLSNVQGTNAGSYSVLVTNLASSTMSSNADLTVDLFPVIMVQPQSQAVAAGANVVFSVATDVVFPAISSGTLSLWLKADAGVVTNSAGQVSQWQDQSGNGNHAGQSNTSLEPLLVHPAAIGGRPALRFDGVQVASEGDFLTGTGNLGLSNALTSFMVYLSRVSNVYEMLPLYVGAPPSGGGCRGNYIQNGKMAFSTWNYDYVSSFVIPTNTYRIWANRLDTSKTKVEFFDRTAVGGTNFVMTASYPMYVPSSGYHVGGLDTTVGGVGSGRNFAGDIAELIWFRGALSEPDRLAVEQYLEQKYFQTGADTRAFTYQWQFNEVAIEGATNATLILTNAQAANAGSYRVIVSNSAGATISTNAILSVIDPVAIIGQPQSQRVAQGSNISFNVVATGTQPLGYQWFFNGAFFAQTTASTLTLTNVQSTNAGAYSVLVTNAVSSEKSLNAILTVDSTPVIPVQPQSQTVVAGTSVVFNVAKNAAFPTVASGTLRLWLKADEGVITNSGGFISQWQDQSTNANHAIQSNTNLQPLLVKSSVIFGRPAVRFDGIQNTTQGDFLQGYGDVGLTNAYTSFLVYQLQNATPSEQTPAVVGVPMSYNCVRGYYIPSGKLAFSAWGNDYNTGFLIPTNSCRIWTDRLNDGRSQIEHFDKTLTVSNGFVQSTTGIGTPGAGYYIGGLGSQTRNFAGDVAELIYFRGSLIESDRLAVEQYLLQKYFSEDTAYTYQWRFNGTNIAGATNAALTLTNVQWANEGAYSVIVNNGSAWIASSNAMLTVLAPPIITKQPQDQTVAMGSSTTFSVEAGGTQPLTYRWILNATNLTAGTNASLILTNVQTTNVGYYSVIVSNSFGWDSSRQAHLSVGIVTATNFTVGTLQNQPFALSAEKFLASSSDSLNYPLILSTLSTSSTNGGKVVFADGTATYTPLTNFTGSDMFSYTVTTEYGGSATGNVRVQVFAIGQSCGSFQPLVSCGNGKIQLSFSGVPGLTYRLQRASSVTGPWTPITNVTADSFGSATLADPNPPADTAFYRMTFP